MLDQTNFYDGPDGNIHCKGCYRTVGSFMEVNQTAKSMVDTTTIRYPATYRLLTLYYSVATCYKKLVKGREVSRVYCTGAATATRARAAAAWCSRPRRRRRRRRGTRSTSSASPAQAAQRGSTRDPSARDRARIQVRCGPTWIFVMEQHQNDSN